MNDSQLERIFDKAKRLNIEFDENDTKENKLQAIADFLGLKNFNNNTLNVLENKLDDKIAQMNYGNIDSDGNSNPEYLDSTPYVSSKEDRTVENNNFDNEDDSNFSKNFNDTIYQNDKSKKNNDKTSSNNGNDNSGSYAKKNDLQEDKNNNAQEKLNSKKGNGSRDFPIINEPGKRINKKQEQNGIPSNNKKNSLTSNFLNMRKNKNAYDINDNKILKNPLANLKKRFNHTRNNIKDKTKARAKDSLKSTGKLILKGIKSALKILMSTPIGWVIIAATVLFIMILLFFGFFGNDSENSDNSKNTYHGYYEPAQDFNNATVANSYYSDTEEEGVNPEPEPTPTPNPTNPIKNSDDYKIDLLINDIDSSKKYEVTPILFNKTNIMNISPARVLPRDVLIEQSQKVSLENFVITSSYEVIKDLTNEELIKAILLIYKTNTFALGEYNSDEKICLVEYEVSDVPTSEYNRIKKYYDELYDYLYLSSFYNGPIKSISMADALDFDEEILNKMKNEVGTFDEILDKTYNNDGSNYGENNSEFNNYDFIYIGDSRTSQMRYTNKINDSNTVYGASLGYDWFVGNPYKGGNTNSPNGGIAGANSKMDNGKNYNIVIWLGVNDIGMSISAETYYNKYYELATGIWKNHNLYIIEVGPVASNNLNNKITEWNSKLASLISSSGLSNLKYIDINYNIEHYQKDEKGNEDGLHYLYEDYSIIYDMIMEQIKSNSSIKKLYKLSDHIQFYNAIYKNDAWWWPIGSKETTTIDGKLFASGEPDTYRLSSPFGPRIDPVTKKPNTLHKGQDIGASKGVYVIAAKDGTVTKTANNCIEGDMKCGGGYGNHIYIDHDESFTSRYAHLETNSVVVNVGEKVKQGQIIAKVGHTGKSTAPHLHFEILKNGVATDPMQYVKTENPRPVTVQSFDSSEYPLHTTRITREYFINSLNTYCNNNSCHNLFKQVFIPNAGNIYDWSLKYNINPEYIVVRATIEGFSPAYKIPSKNNYWGIGCYNGEPLEKCTGYNSLEDGIRGVASLRIVKENETLEEMQYKYAHIGYHWYQERSSDADKINWGLGGCIYLDKIKKYLSPQRYAVIAPYCNYSNKCYNVGRGKARGNCLPTNDEDQTAYTKYNMELMVSRFKAIFNY